MRYMEKEALPPLYVEPTDNLSESLEPYTGLPVQLSFASYKRFKQVGQEGLEKELRARDIAVRSIHLPTIDVDSKKFERIVGDLQDRYNVNLFTIHPQNVSPEKALGKLETMGEWATKRGIDLSYENFPRHTRKWINTPESICTLSMPYTSFTFDTTHLDLDDDLMGQMRSYLGRISVLHLSDRKGCIDDLQEHMPVGVGDHPMEELMDFLRIHYDGQIVLDYGPEYKDQLFNDVSRIPAILDRSRMPQRYSLYMGEEEEVGEHEIKGKPHWKNFYNQDGRRVRMERRNESGQQDFLFTFDYNGNNVNEYVWGPNHQFIERREYKDVESGIIRRFDRTNTHFGNYEF